jgi:hypothetical protein
MGRWPFIDRTLRKPRQKEKPGIFHLLDQILARAIRTNNPDVILFMGKLQAESCHSSSVRRT